MFKKNILLLSLITLIAACASIGSPDGGPYDEDPPVFVASVPRNNATGVKEKRIILDFNENIKLESAFEKVVISPPQMEMPQIKHLGKRVTVELYDSLKPNTTYSIDFNDAIVDNNESNPLENFAFVFSTGEQVDTLGVSGVVLNAEDLEPIKGALVGLYAEGNDTAFTTTAFERLARTDSRGRFTVKGIAPGRYRIYALEDANQNYFFDQKSERLAFTERVVEPYTMPAMRPDTVWIDSVTIDTIVYTPYIRYMPDDIVLRAFYEPFSRQYLQKSERKSHNTFTLTFTDANDTMPEVKLLDFPDVDAYIVEASERNDTLQYWLKDSTVFWRDTLNISVRYYATDTLGLLSPRIDTLSLVPRKRIEKILEEKQKEYEKQEKAFLKRAKNRADYDENNPPKYIEPLPELKIRSNAGGKMDVNRVYTLSFDEPLAYVNSDAVHVYKVLNDSTDEAIPFIFERNERKIREYNIYAEWRPEEKFKVVIDSAAFRGFYGATSEAFDESITFKSLDEYAVLHLDIPRVDNNAVVQLMGAKENMVQVQRTENGKCSFYYIKPGKYYMRLFIDANGNGVWDTGNYEEGIQPEEVYYYPRQMDLRALFVYEQDDWDILAPLNEQKPLEITKQKPDRERKKRNRNAQRQFK